jgi:hypothetical protein
MPGELENALRNVAEQVAGYVQNAAEMKVITRFERTTATPGQPEEQPPVIVSTVIKLDGDSESVVPVRATKDGLLEIETALLELHRTNVNVAIEYRARILDALLKSSTGRQQRHLIKVGP